MSVSNDKGEKNKVELEVTDRELLAFCSLTKMQLQFSQYEKKDESGITVGYLTIRDLIKDELAGQKNRRENESNNPLIAELKEIESEIDDKIMEMLEGKGEEVVREIDREYIKDSIIKRGEHILLTSDESLELQTKWKKYHAKVDEIKEEKIEIGMIYDKDELKGNPFLYKEQDELGKKAPMIMEFYDTPLNEESKFMTEWEVVYAGDSYTMGKYLYEETIRKSTNYKEEEKAEKLKHISTRQQMKDRNMKKQVMETMLTMLDFAVSVFFSIGGSKGVKVEEIATNSGGTLVNHIIIDGMAPIPFEDRATMKAFRTLVEKVAEGKNIDKIAPATRGMYEKYMEMSEKGVLLPKSVDRTSDFLTVTNTQGGLLEKMISSFIGLNVEDEQEEIYLEDLEKELVPYKTAIELNGVNIVVLRKKIEESFQYVLVIEDTAELKNVDEQLKDGLLPDEVQILVHFMNELIGMFDIEKFKPILTGVKNAGKLATVLALMLSDSKLESITPIRCFYSNKPYNLAAVKFFTVEDINSFFEDKAIYNSWDLAYSPIVNRAAVLIVASFFSSPAIVLLAALNPWTFFAYLAAWIIPIVQNYIKKMKLEKIIEHLEEKKIIEGMIENFFIFYTTDENGVTYRYNKKSPLKIGHISSEALKEKYNIEYNLETIQSLELESYLQLWYYKNIKGYEIFKDANNENIFKTKIPIDVTHSEEEIEEPNYAVSLKVTVKYCRIDIERKNNKIEIKRIAVIREIIKHNTQVIYDSDGKYIYDEKWNNEVKKEEVIPTTLDDSMGKLLVQILEYFKNIQQNSEKNILSSYYLVNNRPQKIKSFTDMEKDALQLEYSRKGKKVVFDSSEFNLKESEVKTDEYSYFPYVQKDGYIITDKRKRAELSFAYTGAFIRSIYRYDKSVYKNEYNEDRPYGKYFDRSLPPISQRIESLGSSVENINMALKEDILQKGKEFPNFTAVKEKLEEDNWEEMLKKLWEVNEEGKDKILILKQSEGKTYDPNAITYSYNIKDPILSRAVSLKLTDKYSGIIGEAKETQVADGAILKCSGGEGELQLKVTSQNFSYIGKMLEATVMDGFALINIVPNETKCKNNKYEPCRNHIIKGLGYWKKASKENNVMKYTVLLQNSYIECVCGGKIEIKDAKTKIKSE